MRRHLGHADAAGGLVRVVIACVLAALPVAASAQSCPSGALRTIEGATPLVLLAIHNDDAYFNDASLSPGTVLTVDGELHKNGDCWFGGSMSNDSGGSFYFYKAAFGPITDACPHSALVRPIEPGEALSILATHSDSSEDERERLAVGTTVVVRSTVTHRDDCWVAGTVELTSGERVAASGVALGTLIYTTRQCSQTIAVTPGDWVQVRAIHPYDPYATVASQVVGLTGQVHSARPGRDGCWTEAELDSADGVRFRFSRVELAGAIRP